MAPENNENSSQTPVVDSHVVEKKLVELKQVIVLRKDLGMNKGKMIAQGAHAAMMCMLEEQTREHTAYILRWAFGSMAKIAVGVDDEATLNALETAARDAGLLVYAVIDSGKTVAACAGAKTAIAIGPGRSEDIDLLTKHLKLL